MARRPKRLAPAMHLQYIFLTVPPRFCVPSLCKPRPSAAEGSSTAVPAKFFKDVEFRNVWRDRRSLGGCVSASLLAPAFMQVWLVPSDMSDISGIAHVSRHAFSCAHVVIPHMHPDRLQKRTNTSTRRVQSEARSRDLVTGVRLGCLHALPPTRLQD
eukprot:364938-Chlamydomonas_euryale.AAC.28